jgi:predicted transcriptional regulator
VARKTRCPTCNQWMPDPDYMTPEQLKGIRGVVGIRLRYEGPMPKKRFCRYLHVSPRTLYNYEAGVTEIPSLVAQRARELRDDQTLKLPKSWDDIRRRELEKKRKWRKRKEERDRRKLLDDEGPEPPF